MNQNPVNNNFKVSAKARSDLIQIGRYTESKWGRGQRNHYLKQLDEAFKLIADNPGMGRGRSHVLAGYRSFQQSSHVIYYREAETIQIIRVLHKRMDVKKHMRRA